MQKADKTEKVKQAAALSVNEEPVFDFCKTPLIKKMEVNAVSCLK